MNSLHHVAFAQHIASSDDLSRESFIEVNRSSSPVEEIDDAIGAVGTTGKSNARSGTPWH